MNRTTVFVTFSILSGLGLIVVAVIAVLRPDATATLVAFVGTTIAVIGSFAVTANGLEKVRSTVKQVEAQTNGRLSWYSNRNAQLVRLLVENGIDIPAQEEKESSHEK